jgi:hypothetical protein
LTFGLLGDEGTKRCEILLVECVEFERVRMPVDVVLIAYGCGLDLKSSFGGEEGPGKGREVEEEAGEG